MDLDKENITPEKVKVKTPKVRTPLQELNIPRSTCLMKKAQYSQVTPHASPLQHTPKRLRNSVISSPSQVCLNALIYRKLDQIICQKNEEHQKELEAKDAEIARLMGKVQTQSVVKETQTSPNQSKVYYEDIDEISQFVENILENAALEVQAEMDSNEKITKAKSMVNLGTSSLNMAESINDCMHCTMCRASSIDTVHTPLKSTVADTCDRGVSTTPYTNRNSYTCTTPIKRKDTCSTGVSTTPISNAHMGISTTPKIMDTRGSCMTPRRLTHREIITSPVRIMSVDIREIETDTEGLLTAHEIYTDTEGLIQMQNISSDTEGLIAVKHTETCMSPCNLITSEVRLAGTQTANETLEQATNTESGQTCEQTTNTESSSVCRSTNTEEVITMSQETCTTPKVKQVDSGVATSPLFLALPRFSDLDVTGMRSSELAPRLEAATISNTLLRDELSLLQRRRDSLEHHLQVAMDSHRDVDTKVHSARMEAQTALQRELQQVLEQQGQQLQQIAELQAELAAVRQQAQSDLQKQQQLHQHLQDENYNLQDDLTRAYKQYKQEIANLKEEYANKDYKPYYVEAQRTIQELQVQLDAFTNLGETVKEFEVTQMDVHSFLEEGFKQLEYRTRKQAQQSRQWEEEYETWMRRIEDKEYAVREAVSSRDELQQQVVCLEKELGASKDRLIKVQAAHEETSLELVRATDQVEDLQEERYNLSRKLDSSEKEKEDLKQQLEDMEQKCEDLESQTRRIQHQLCEAQNMLAKAEMDRAVALEAEQELQAIKKKMQKMTDLQTASRENEEFRESELQLQREELAELKSQLEDARNQLKDEMIVSESRSQDLEWLNQFNQQLGEKIEELEQQLEHTKTQAHQLLMNQNSEITMSLLSLGQMGDVLSSLQATLLSQLTVWNEFIKNQKEKSVDKIKEMELCEISLGSSQRYLALSNGSHVNVLKDNEKEEQANGGFDNEANTTLIEVEDQHNQEKEEQLGDWFSPTKAAEGQTPQTNVKSFLSQILNAANGIPSPVHFNDYIEEDDDLPAKPPIYNSHEKVNAENETDVSKNSKTELGKPISAFVKIQPRKDISLASEMEPESSNKEEEFSDSNNQRLNDVVSTLVNQVQSITDAFRELYNLVGESSGHGQTYIEELENALARERTMHRRYLVCHTDKMQGLQTQLALTQRNEAHLQEQVAELNKTTDALRQQLHEMREQFEQYTADVQAALEKQSYKVLEKEVTDLRHDLQVKEADLVALQESLESTLSRVSGHHNDVSSILRESAVLRKEVNRLRLKHVRYRDDAEKVEAKLRRKVKVLEENWQKAEKELLFVDHLVERIRQMLREHEEVMNWPEHKLLCELGLWDSAEYSTILYDNSHHHPPSTRGSDKGELVMGTPV